MWEKVGDCILNSSHQDTPWIEGHACTHFEAITLDPGHEMRTSNVKVLAKVGHNPNILPTVLRTMGHSKGD